jgi:hypothetical protein
MIFRWLFLGMLLTGGLNAQNLLKNAGFEELNPSNKFPVSWQPGAYGGAVGTILADSENPGKGTGAICLKQTSPKGWMGCNQTVLLKEPLKSPRQVTWSILACMDQLASGQLVITAGTKEKPQRQWVSVQAWKGSSEWKVFSSQLTIEAGADRIIFSIRTAGTGTLWADECSLVLEDDPELVVNGSMTGAVSGATGLPDGWALKMYHGLEADGSAELQRNGYQGGNAILLKWKGGARRFGVETAVKAIRPGAAVYQVSGMVRTSEDGRALFGVELLDAKGNKLEELFSPPVSSVEWRKMDFEFSTTPETASFKLYCLSGETGTVSFADLKGRKLDREAARNALPLAARLQPVEWNKVWNGGESEFTSFAGGPLPLSFHFKGQKSKLKQAALVLEVPAGLRLADAFCMHAGNYGREVPRSESINRPEGAYIRYTFENIRPFRILQNEYGWARKLIVVLAGEQESGTSGKVFWRLRNDGQQGPEESFNFREEKLQPGALPKDFRIFRWETNDFLYTDNDILLKSAGLLEQIGMNVVRRQPKDFARGAEINDILEKRNWKFLLGTPDYVQVRFLPKAYMEKLNGKAELAVNADGSIKKADFCPDYFTDDPDFIRVFQAFFKEHIQRYELKADSLVCMDVEPWGTMDWCFCERSRKKFAQGLQLAQVPTAAEIKQKYAHEWSEFRCRNSADVLRLQQEVIKRDFPHLQLGDYDYVVDFARKDYQSNFFGVAKDPRLNEPYFDVHLASYYHYIDKKAFDMMRMNTRGLKKGYIPICAIDEAGSYLTASEIINPAQARLMLIAAAVNGSVGFAIYPGLHLDGRFLQAFGRGMNEIAVLEEYFKLGRQDAPEITVAARPYQSREISGADGRKTLYFPHWDDHLAFSAIPKGDERLVTVFNYHPETVMFADIKAEVKAGSYTVFDPVNRIKYQPEPGRDAWSAAELGKGFPVKIAPRDVCFILISQSPLEGGSVRTLPGLEADFKQARERFSVDRQFKARRSGGLSIELADSNQDGSPEIELASTYQKVRVDYLRTGAVVNWEVAGSEPEKKVSFLNDKLWLPPQARGAFENPYSVQSTAITGNQAEVVLVKKHAQLPVELRKTLRIDAETASLQVEYQLRNTGKAPVRLSLWLSNLIDGGVPPGFYLEQAGEKRRLTEKNSALIFPLNNSEPPEGHKTVSGTVSAPDSEMQLGAARFAVVLSPEHLMNYYFWLSPAVNTWEWMYKPVVLQPGQSWQTSLILKRMQ